MSRSPAPDPRPTRLPQPVILIRGFGGIDVEDEKAAAYQGFNDGTVYPHKRGENRIFEGIVLRFLKSNWRFHDATNVVGFHANKIPFEPSELLDAPELRHLDRNHFFGHKVVIDPGMALSLLRSAHQQRVDPLRTLWVFRYYDLDDRSLETYADALVRLVDFVRDLAARPGAATAPKVNVIAHSMGGLLVRHALQRTYPLRGVRSRDYINKVVTLGTPHRGIAFQRLPSWVTAVFEADPELAAFDPEAQEREDNPVSYKSLASHFPLERFLTVVGTNYRSYAIRSASALNRLSAWSGEFGWNYNRSDGLVKQVAAQIPGAPRTFVHKCHGGPDSLVTSREAFEIATRFFFGNVRARLRLIEAKVERGMDWFGKSEFFLGVSIKPRRVDFELLHQSAEAENCYGPFREIDFSDPEVAFGWAGSDRLVWEGWLDTTQVMTDASVDERDMVLRLDFYVGERDLFGVGFSDNVIFRKQYYVRAVWNESARVWGEGLQLSLHTSENLRDPAHRSELRRDGRTWQFPVGGTGFSARFGIELEAVPEYGGEPLEA